MELTMETEGKRGEGRIGCLVLLALIALLATGGWWAWVYLELPFPDFGPVCRHLEEKVEGVMARSGLGRMVRGPGTVLSEDVPAAAVPVAAPPGEMIPVEAAPEEMEQETLVLEETAPEEVFPAEVSPAEPVPEEAEPEEGELASVSSFAWEAAPEQAPAERLSPEAMELLEETVYRLAPLAKTRVEAEELMGYDSGQCFAARLEQARRQLDRGDAAMHGERFAEAKEAYETALATADWLQTNALLRAEVREKRAAASEIRRKALELDGPHLGLTDWREGERQREAAMEAYEQAVFMASGEAWMAAAEAYGRAEAAARTAKLEQALAALRGAGRRNAWAEILPAAGDVLALDPGNAEAKALKREAERRGLETAREALVRGAWKEASAAADAILARDPGNAGALSVKNGVKAAKVAVGLESGRQAMENGEWEKAMAFAERVLAFDPGNAEAEALKAGIRSARLERKLVVLRAAWSREAWEDAIAAADAALALDPGNVEAEMLKEASREKLRPGIHLTAFLDGREVEATVTKGLRHAGVTTPTTVDIVKGGRYSFSLEYQEGNRHYIGCTSVVASARGKTEATVELQPTVRTIALGGGCSMDLVWCPGTPPGGFRMGSPDTEAGRDDDETPHTVALEHDFWVGMTEVTQGQWAALMGGETVVDLARKALLDNLGYELNDGKGSISMRAHWGLKRTSSPKERCGSLDDDVPVYNVSWAEAREFCSRLTEEARLGGWLPEGYVFRLPTEAEWEYACRAGTTAALPDGTDLLILGENNAPALDSLAWYGGNSSVGFAGEGWTTARWPGKQYPGGLAAARRVKGKKANAWGLYDMVGNVWEWCLDEYAPYPEGTGTDPLCLNDSSFPEIHRVIRGGSWKAAARRCRSAARSWCPAGFRDIDIGFRVVCAAAPEGEDDIRHGRFMHWFRSGLAGGRKTGGAAD